MHAIDPSDAPLRVSARREGRAVRAFFAVALPDAVRAACTELAEELAAAPEELPTRAKELQAPIELVQRVAETGRLPVPNFAAGGIATPPDAALCMSLGAEAVFVGSGIFKSEDPASRARAIVRATTHWDEPEELLAACRGLKSAMPGIELDQLEEHERMANRGW